MFWPSGTARIVVEGFAAGALGLLEDRGEARALGGGEVGAHLGAVVVGEDGDLIVGAEGTLERGERVVDLLHGVEGDALIDHQGDGEGEGVDGE